MRLFLQALFRRQPRASSLAERRIQAIQSRTISGSMTAAVLYAASMTTPTSLGAVPEDAETKPHHNKHGKGFINPWDSYIDFTGPEMFKKIFMARVTGTLKSPDTTPPHVKVVEPTFLSSRTASSSLRATWLGHACYYVEFPSGLRVLFDPVFEERCSPLSSIGPKRYTEVPCHIKDLPHIDLVVISHSHYDHLSHPTVTAIHKSHPNAQFLVGLGLKDWFHKSGIKNVQEMDWWTDIDITLSPTTGEKRISTASSTTPSTPSSENGNILARISCLPCQHTSARTPFDKAHTLWCSWAVSSGGKSVWFGGDSGYRSVPWDTLPKNEDDYSEKHAHLPVCPAFKQIGELRGPFDLGLIPIGAYDPRSIMSPMHANPYDSVNIFVDTRCKRAMGIHWGTWVLTGEDVLEPPRLLKEAMGKKRLPETGAFDVCDIGESREF